MSGVAFPPGFVFGAATSAYQIEGGHDADGKGPSVWDRFVRRPGRVHHGHTGDVAAGAYRDFQTDVAIMGQLGLDAYRFSISWPRVLPAGRRPVNERGLDYYDRLVDALLAAGIAPFVTLFHWDLPQALQEAMGGFAGRDCAALFADYAEVVARRLGDRVGHWITLNEPWVYAVLGHLRGTHAPGRRNPWAFLRAVHHQLLGHGLAVPRLRALSPAARVGLSLNLSPIYPAANNDADRAAARLADQAVNRLFLDPLFHGYYPDALWARLRPFRPPIRPDDMATIAAPLDFVGVNYYTRARVRRAWYVPFLGLWPEGLAGVGRVGNPPASGSAEVERRVANPPYKVSAEVERRVANPPYSGSAEVERRVANPPYSGMGWEVYPAGLFELLWRLKTEYGNPSVYVTENGAAYPDVLSDDGRVHDEARRAYLEQHLAVVAAAIRAGVDARGYFVWSLVDNFEWTYGYDKRFGIVYVDYATQRRVIKDSGLWYSEFIRNAQVGGTQPDREPRARE